MVSKVEVLKLTRHEYATAFEVGGIIVGSILNKDKPALLAALLEDARAYKVSIKLGKMEFGGGKGKLWFLPIPEDTP